MSLTEFLLARIAEDEAAIAHIRKDPGNWHAIPWDRILAECKAKRQIVALASWTGPKDKIRDMVFGPAADLAFQKGVEISLRFLAAVYADHPDYLPEWKP